MADKVIKTKRAATEDELVFVALGGLGEIGMNAYLYGLGPSDARQWLMVDCGITFPEGEFDPGIDVILPDLRFIEAERAALAGLVITHAHEDHIGAVLELWPRLRCPVYATPFTAGMLRAKRDEYGGARDMQVKIIPAGGRFTAGPFDVEFVTMAHSVPETSGLAIRTPAGLVFHTADWKLDATPYIGIPPNEKRYQELGDEGVLALVCDSTNAMRDGRSPSESEVANSIKDIIKKAKSRVIVTTFSSNVARIKAVGDAARACGRKLVVAGRALHRVIDVAIDTGYLPETFTYVDQRQFSYLNREDVVCLCTGSQGEPRAALARVSENEHPDIKLTKGDLVIFSSRTIPGNEKEVGRIMNGLVLQGCDILTDSEALVHVTGHPRRDELRQMYAWTRPKIAVPMHGEARHLKAHAQLAAQCGAGKVYPMINGEVLRLSPGAPKIIDDAPVGRLFRDGRLIVPSDEGPVKDRRKLASVGIVIIALVLSQKGEVLSEPHVVLDGVPAANAAGDAMSDIVMTALEGTLKSISPARRKDPAALEDSIKRAVRAAVADAWGKKPIAKVLISVINQGK